MKGHGNTKFILHKQLQLMAYRTSLNKKYYNSGYLIVVDSDDEYFYLKTQSGDTIKIYIKFTNHFKPLYGIAVHKTQGMTIDKPYSIYEYDKKETRYVVCCLNQNFKIIIC